MTMDANEEMKRMLDAADALADEIVALKRKMRNFGYDWKGDHFIERRIVKCPVRRCGLSRNKPCSSSDCYHRIL